MRKTHDRMSGAAGGGKPAGAGPVTLAQLESFAALARWGKQAAAQAALGKSQSQISRDLAALERAVGVRLVDRRARSLTAAGQRCLDYAGEVLGGWARVCGEAAGESGGAGEVRLAAEPEVIAGALVPVLGELRGRYPGLEVRLAARSGGQLAAALASGEADVAVLPEGAPVAELAVRPFLTARVLVAVPGGWALARKARVGLAALRGRTLLVPARGSWLREAVEAALVREGVRRPALSEVGPGRDAALGAAAAGLGAAFLLAFEAVGDPLLRAAPAGVVLRPAGPEFPPIRYSLAIRKNRAPGGPAGLLVKELLRAARGGA